MVLGCANPLEVCCSCHIARVSTFPLSLHDLPDLSHAGASGLEWKSDTFSDTMHTLLNGLFEKNADDGWEELRLSTFCDASFGTRCFGGYKVKLTGSRGSSFLIEWASRLQGPQSTSSTESESIEWRRAAKAMLRVNGALDACRLKPVPSDGYVDIDALRMAVSRGSSGKLGHLRVHADTCFRFLAQLPISPHWVSTTENEADIMTKVLSAVRHRELCKTDFDLDGVPVASFMTHTAVSTHWMEESGRTGRGLLVLVRNCTAADQTDSYVEVRRKFLLTTGSENVFLESSSPIVRKGGARETWRPLSLRTETRTVKYNVVKCPMRQRDNLKTRHPRVWESFSASSAKRQQT